jgi:DNA-binding response OmpR family regulator
MEEKKKILIIEDEEDIAKLISFMLISGGYDAEISYDANDALNKMFHLIKIDLILLDISIPVMDGWEFLEIIRAKEETKDIPVMIITARTGIRSKTLALQRGAQDFITKPFTRKNLLTRINNLLTTPSTNMTD